ncbi:MAG: 3-demethylubiquinone-9 3-O-methyltransferase, partial [Bdellovibrionales bacterium]|nr:3-demethylubiquinone-9 3-O-methyltransferase [Bdellovibrionales bacterium]
SRVLKPGGRFFFHTFNRNFLAWFVVIKLVEWLIPKTPKNMHVLKLFIKPKELNVYCQLANMKVKEMVGIKPVISSIPLTKIFSGSVPPQMRFELTGNLFTSFMGVADKQ